MIRRIALLTVGMLLVSGLAFAQTNSATANATVEILTPLTIVNNTELNFGVLGVNGADTYSVSAAGTPAAGSGNVTQFGSVAAATFTVSGAPARQFNVTVTTSSATLVSGANTIAFSTDDTFASCDPCTLDGTGSLALSVGGEITLGANQAAGVYDAPSLDAFSVTVIY